MQPCVYGSLGFQLAEERRAGTQSFGTVVQLGGRWLTNESGALIKARGGESEFDGTGNLWKIDENFAILSYTSLRLGN